MRRARAAAQLLGGPGAPAADVVRHLLGVQAQDPRTARPALLARGAEDVDAALADGSLVTGWLMRGTLHLVAREDFRWLHGLTGRLNEATCRRRLDQLGGREATAEIVATLAGSGPLDRAAIGERLPLRTEGQILPHMLGLAAAQGEIVLDGERRFALTRDVLGDPAAVDRDKALAELARRYLAAHAPASDADLAQWSGLPLRDVRAGLAAVEPPRPEPRRTPPRLLPAFDPYMLGWRDRSFAVPEEHAKAVHPGGGIVRATMVDDGRVVGTWTTEGLEPFAELPTRTAAAFERRHRALTGSVRRR